ncbi:MAG: FecR domain-containing protein [Candidatus Riflebacteria bacterium]|nr:FecR domain-containing protein [Candidatus Riflebacteria bacterium]
MKKVFLLSLVFVLSSISCFGENKIVFHLLRGRAALLRNVSSTWLDLSAEPIQIRPTEKLRTESETKAELRFPDGSVLRIKPNTIFTLLEASIQLQVGEIWLDLQTQARGYQVITPTVICGVLGTSFNVSVDRFGKTQVKVLRGIVSIRAHDERSRQLVLQKGMMANISDKKNLPSQPQKFDPKMEEIHMNEAWALVPQFDPRKPPLARRESKGLPGIYPEIIGSSAYSFNKKENLQIKSTEGQGIARPPVEERLEKEPSPEGSVRERLEFFDGLRKGTPPGSIARPGSSGDDYRKVALGLLPLPPGTQAFTGTDTPSKGLLRPEETRPFGEGEPNPPKFDDSARIRDELSTMDSEISQLNLEISNVQNEISVLQNQLPGYLHTSSVNSQPVTTNTTGVGPIREKIQELTGELEKQRERHEILMQRISDLRGRMR